MGKLFRLTAFSSLRRDWVLNPFAIALGIGAALALRDSASELNASLGNLIVAGITVALIVKS